MSGSNVSSGRHSVGVAAIAGGVVDALLAVTVLLILVMVTVVIIFKYRNNNQVQSKRSQRSRYSVILRLMLVSYMRHA